MVRPIMPILKEATMDKLHMKCTCGDSFVLAQGSKAEGFHVFGHWGANFDKWLDQHWPCMDDSKPLREAFTLEDNASMKEGG